MKKKDISYCFVLPSFQIFHKYLDIYFPLSSLSYLISLSPYSFYVMFL